MASIAIEGSGTAWFSMWKVCTGAKYTSPPCIMEEVAIRVVLHRILNGCRRIPECRPGRFARFELCGALAQNDAPKSRRRRSQILSGDNVERSNQFAVIVVTQRLLNE